MRRLPFTHALAPCALLAFALAASPAAAQDSNKASIAVAPFTFHKNVRAQPGAELETATLTKKFITELGQSNKFDVVERDELDRLLKEMELSDSGLTDPSRSVEAGQVYGVDYFLMGEVSVFTVTTRVKPVPRTTRFLREVELRLIADMRIVDARTSRIVSTEKGDVGRIEKKMYTSRPAVNAPVEPAILDELQRELCAQLVTKVIDAVFPLKIISVNASGLVFVNRGRSAGIAEGDEYDCYTQGEALVDPDTGETLGSEETKVGRIRITSVLAKFSKAEILGGQPDKGQICRPARGAADFAPPPPPPPPRDTTPPSVSVLAPKEGQELNATPINIVASASDDMGVVRVTINGAEVPADAQGHYRVVIRQPSEGGNMIRVEAWDAAGNRGVAERRFTFDSTPPVIDAEASLLVEGKVDDLDCTLTINGVPVKFDPGTGEYSARVPADPANPGRVVIVATDRFGNKSTEVRSVR